MIWKETHTPVEQSSMNYKVGNHHIIMKQIHTLKGERHQGHLDQNGAGHGILLDGMYEL